MGVICRGERAMKEHHVEELLLLADDQLFKARERDNIAHGWNSQEKILKNISNLGKSFHPVH